MSESDLCWCCDDPEIVYVDVFGLGWCQECYDEIYLYDPS